MDRRQFLKVASAGLVAASLKTRSLFAKSEAGLRAGNPAIKYIRENVPLYEMPAYRGRYYNVWVPDTLDLAERARISLAGALTRQCDPLHDYETYQEAEIAGHPPFMYHSFHDFNGCQPKYLEILPLFRLMTGSSVNMDSDIGMFNALLRMTGPDGLVYSPVEGRPWALFDCWNSVLRGVNMPPSDVKQIFSLWPHGRSIITLCTWLSRDPDNPLLTEPMQAMIQGTPKYGLEHKDFLWYPCELIYRTPDKILAAAGTYGGSASAPVPLEQAFAEAAAKEFQASPMACCDAGPTLQGFARYFRMTGDERVGQVTGQLARYVRQAFREDGSFSPAWGHTHSNCFSLMGLLDYADLFGNDEFKQVAKGGYEYGRRGGVPLLGYYPHFTGDGIADSGAAEGCNLGDMVILAVKLSELGVAAYWVDVDMAVRNHLVETQLTDVEWLHDTAPGQTSQAAAIPGQAVQDPVEASRGRVLGIRPASEVEHLLPIPGFVVDQDVPERIRGCFSSAVQINDWPRSNVSSCCTANGNRAFYYAWRGILKYEQDLLKVNLLLNRASPWADINSHLPYQGRVDIHMKKSSRVKVRIPLFVEQGTVKLTVDGAERPFGWEGRYLDCGGVNAGQMVKISFPLEERTVVVQGPFGKVPSITLILKGNDVVDMRPVGVQHRLYKRDHYRQNETKWVQRTRFETEENPVI